MKQRNPYEAPGAPLLGSLQEPRGKAVLMILAALTLAQFLLALFSVPTILELTRAGVLHPVHLLSSVVSSVLLLVGGALLAFRSPKAIGVFMAAAVLACLALWFWQSLVSISCAVLAAGCWWFSVHALRTAGTEA